MNTAITLSLGIGIFMLLIKLAAYIITDSAAIFSDTTESIVHILAVSFAAYSFHLSMKPADRTHMYGHDRISFFSAGFEGAMIVFAALFSIYKAISKWLSGLGIQHVDLGITLTVVATIVNGGLGWYLIRQGKKHHFLILEANGKHVLTDSWTSLGVIVGLILTLLTGWLPFDPILAILIALNICWTGGKLIRQSIGGLMDESNLENDAEIREILFNETSKFNIQFHGLRHRNAGNRIIIEFHLLFPENVSLSSAHKQATLIEQELHKAMPGLTDIISHLEPFKEHDEIHDKVFKERND